MNTARGWRDHLWQRGLVAFEGANDGIGPPPLQDREDEFRGVASRKNHRRWGRSLAFHPPRQFGKSPTLAGSTIAHGAFPASVPGDLPPAFIKHLQLRIAGLGSRASMFSSSALGIGRFEFERDTFAFANELIWEYRFDRLSGAMATTRTNPPPEYAHRCFVMVRSVRQFFYHARFEDGRPVEGTDAYRRLIRQVVGRRPWQPSQEPNQVVIPGYHGLRSFSQEQGALLKAECGGAWQSYALRSHWRMVFPISRHNQARLSTRLLESLAQQAIPIVHLVRFPQLTINHGVVLFDHLEDEKEIRFAAYDPNQPDRRPS